MRKVFTQAALAGRSVTELRALFAAVQQELVRSEAGSKECRDALASLDNISCAIKHRLRGPGF
ncbi:hypothetical protein DEA8626_01460 [Defluviimonas aquaemixtae]|uniref:HPt domain-containing protein n=1 Tax=Albidovulum aquaemixtae TaxID=1542388 RepID=A0A2R8B5T3_9RHOB|nr:hypothetical protein [Defluviimonas aquaemixtae]SPH17932.1 hypothetical protein DEA8626_01460 [Defluviimonas aquaemixtae]